MILETRQGSHKSPFFADLPQTAGIADVRRNRDVYYGEIDKHEMEGLLAKLETLVSSEKLFYEEFQKLAPKHFYDYACSPDRADWLSLFDLSPQSVVMDYGAGLGNFALALSNICGEVWSVDSTPHRLQLIGYRAQAEKKANIHLMLADSPEALPFPTKKFDLILLNGVLEWTALKSGMRPDDFHVGFIENLSRYLKTGGRIVVAIENRFGLQHFWGETEHNDFPFAALLPRPLASMINRMRGHGNYETYTYSYNGLRNILKRSGLQVSRHYLAFPSYQRARLVLDDRRSAESMAHSLSQMMPGLSRKWQAYRFVWAILARAGLARVLSPAYIIEGTKR